MINYILNKAGVGRTHPKKTKLATAFVVFGATGDLTQRKIYPSLYELAKRGLLPEEYHLYGIARQKMSVDDFKKTIKKDLKKKFGRKLDVVAVDKMLQHVHYISADLNERAGYDELEKMIEKEELKLGHAIMRIFYLALPPKLFSQVINNVQTCKMGKNLCTAQHILSRVIIEKPFGHNLASAKKLDKRLSEVFDERQIFRIDHYLGKEAFQNIFTWRFANTLFESKWNNKAISSIHINALETVGLEERTSYYDGAGAIRDMIQNHLMQLLAYITMNEPEEMSAAAIHKSKQDLLKAVRPFNGQVSMVQGQYAGYTKEEGISVRSKTETYVGMKLEIDNPRWRGVPIYVRTGKHLERKETSVHVMFKESSKIFDVPNNQVEFSISPVPSVSIGLSVLAGGFGLNTTEANLHYCRREQIKEKPIGDYERLLLDVIQGEQMLFTSSKEVLYGWEAVEPFLRASKRSKVKRYTKGSLGPKGFDKMLRKDGIEEPRSINSCPLEI